MFRINKYNNNNDKGVNPGGSPKNDNVVVGARGPYKGNNHTNKIGFHLCHSHIQLRLKLRSS